MTERMLAAALLLLLALAALPAAAARAAPRCFSDAAPAITDCVDGRIASFWEQQGGLPVFGYPIAAQRQEQTEAGQLAAQRFERARLELHPENQPPYDVLLGRLGADLLARQGRDWAASPKGDPTAPHSFAETGHAIAPQFWAYWSSHGLEFDGRAGTSFQESLALFGMPLSEAQVETNPTDGKPYLTQWFERARFELHPENAGTPYEVLLGLLQRELDSSGAPPAAQPQAGGFIQVAGSQLTRLGQPVAIKGVNYYPQWWPWSDMWRKWDGPQVERELRQARDQLGINVVRVMLPYNYTGRKNEDGTIPPELIPRLREMAQIVGGLDLRLIVTLFDFYHNFPGSGSAEEGRNLAYLRQLIPAFAGDDRIFAWDLHNEPDHYEDWNDNGPHEVLSWLGRMADVVHALAPKQLVTVGMGHASNLLIPGPDGRRVIDYSDVVSFHTYDAGAVAREIDELRAQTTRPILVEEFGWPTGPACVENYNEETQVQLYRAVLGAGRDRTAGVVAWTLRDYDSGPTARWDSREEHFGLYRPDGSLKPAAEQFRALAGPPLPSTVVTNAPLTSTNPHLPAAADAPLLVPGSGHYVKGLFRQAWDLFGGRESFGLPLSEAFARPNREPLVQYFENAVLEIVPGVTGDSHFKRLSPAEQVVQAIRVYDVGGDYLAARGTLAAAQPIEGPFLDFYNRVNGAWRLGGAISPALTEDVGGVRTTVQYFQRGRLDLNPATSAVVAGPLGKWAWDGLCRR